MTQTLALLLDGYRELNARKLFWVTLILSTVVVLSFAIVGVGPRGLTLLASEFPMREPLYWYKLAFSKVVGFWAAWGAVVLALISTAGIFPDLMAGGSIDLYFSKPIGRLRLFATKYFTGLLFTTVQVSVFAVGSFIVFGLRAHQWRPNLLIMIPLILCLYSYLYCVTVLIGVWTRSTVTAILLTILAWLMFFLTGWVEGQLFDARVSQAYVAGAIEHEVQATDRQIQDLKDKPSVLNAFGVRENQLRARRDRLAREAVDAHQLSDRLVKWHRMAYYAASAMPKTGETVDLLDRQLFTESDLAFRSEFDKERVRGFLGSDEEMKQQFDLAKDAELAATRARRSRSVPWILGTSFAFEALAIGVAAWLFARRDY